MPKTFAHYASHRLQTKLPFRPFDEKADFRVYTRGFLPHWRQAGCTYFVTFRTADSIPSGVVRQWKYERSKWLAARNIDPSQNDWQLKFSALSRIEQQSYQRSFAAQLFNELDKCQGECVLKDLNIASVVADAMMFFHEERVMAGDFVIMPNHVHALLTPINRFDLEDLLHSIKSFTANRINLLRKQHGEFWMPESHDHIVRDGEELLRIQHYIKANPAKAGLDPNSLVLFQSDYQILA